MLTCFIHPVSAQFQKSPAEFKPTDESFKQYQYPEWFRDAKFGIWAHWEPQAVPRQGDWYAKKMYQSQSWDWDTKSFTNKPYEDYT